MRKWRHPCSMIFCCVLWVPLALADAESEYFKFFEKYQVLARAFDPSWVDLYADDAQIHSLRLMDDGVKQTLEMDGKKWKELLASTLNLAKKRGDRSEFSNTQVELLQDSAKITATRYSEIKCFKDPNYYMVVRRTTAGGFEIVEEYSESPVQSRCEEASANDLEWVLEATVTAMNKQLPVMADEDTQLERLSSEGTRLTYHYSLVSYLAEELDGEAFAESLRPGVTQQGCTMPNLKPVLEQGGSLAFTYHGKEGGHVATVVVDGSACR